ncbi:MAG: putative toxin-antitoxin system toxin component, PIN family [Nanoarchaeota archaeon]|nr:putative toxin-antitoxin system toxin component, PIN family [Nanoarchaeota archaeon]
MTYYVIAKGIDGDFRLLTSVHIIEEVIDELRNKFKFPEENIQELIDIIFTYYDIIDPKSRYLIVRDTKDNKILECAFDGNADFIVTGDKDLLVIGQFKQIKILNAAYFLKTLENS